ncbi:MAG: peptidyl-prolyl cis-trans isomerase [Alphaproteobacteria bacterium]|nr:peptidyl-prolyl cis-trans isomerase [Alphaproteobacteria bacterium]
MLRLICVLVAAAFAASAPAAAANPHVKIATSKGDIIVELYPDKAPKTVANFLQYAREGLYDRTIFHRVVAGFVIQGGGYSAYFDERPTHEPVPYEGDNGLKNLRGTIAMARTSDPNSATSQWFINLKDNPKLDHRVTDLGPIYGYAVFGKVVQGMDVVDAIGSVATHAAGPFDAEVPVDAILINRVDEVDWPPAN